MKIKVLKTLLFTNFHLASFYQHKYLKTQRFFSNKEINNFQTHGKEFIENSNIKPTEINSVTGVGNNKPNFKHQIDLQDNLKIDKFINHKINELNSLIDISNNKPNFKHQIDVKNGLKTDKFINNKKSEINSVTGVDFLTHIYIQNHKLLKKSVPSSIPFDESYASNYVLCLEKYNDLFEFLNLYEGFCRTFQLVFGTIKSLGIENNKQTIMVETLSQNDVFKVNIYDKLNKFIKLAKEHIGLQILCIGRISLNRYSKGEDLKNYPLLVKSSCRHNTISLIYSDFVKFLESVICEPIKKLRDFSENSNLLKLVVKNQRVGDVLSKELDFCEKFPSNYYGFFIDSSKFQVGDFNLNEYLVKKEDKIEDEFLTIPVTDKIKFSNHNIEWSKKHIAKSGMNKLTKILKNKRLVYQHFADFIKKRIDKSDVKVLKNNDEFFNKILKKLKENDEIKFLISNIKYNIPIRELKKITKELMLEKLKSSENMKN